MAGHEAPAQPKPKKSAQPKRQQTTVTPRSRFINRMRKDLRKPRRDVPDKALKHQLLSPQIWLDYEAKWVPIDGNMTEVADNTTLLQL
jgi:hypothetical protein